MRRICADLMLLHQDREWYCDTIPEAFLTMTGYTADELEKRDPVRFLSLFSQEDGAALEEAFCQMDGSVLVLPESYRLCRADGSQLNVQIQAEALQEFPQRALTVCLMDITPFVEQYQALELQLNSLECACPGGLCKAVMDEQFTIIWHNQTYLDMLGYTEEQFQTELHGCAQGYVHPEDEAIVQEEFAKLSELIGQSTAREVRIIRRDQEVRTLIIVFSRANEMYHGIPVFYSSGIDITEDKRAKELALETERFQIAIRQNSSCVWEYDIPRKTILASESLCNLLDIGGDIGDAPESLIAGGYVYPEFADHFRRLFDAVSQGTEKTQDTIKFRKADGCDLWCRITLTGVCNDMGIPVKGIAMMEDITERHKLEQAYQEEEKRRASMAFDMVFACQLNLSEDRVMEANEDAFPYDEIVPGATDLIRKTVRDSIHPDDKVRYFQTFRPENLIENFRQGVSEHSLEYRIRNSMGTYSWRQTNARVILEPSRGEILAYIYVRDIDEQKTSELELRERADRDGLTGLYTRYALEIKCRKFLKERDKEQLAALFELDLDGLKMVSDNYGHAKGDELLIKVTDILKAEYTESDAVMGYMGGDGFLAFIPQCDCEAAVQEKAQRVCEMISHAMEKKYGVTASIGIAFFSRDGLDYEALYQCADLALSHAKRKGKSYCVRYEPSIKAQTGTDMLTVSREWLLDEANDIVYISDLHTYDLLYMNSNMKKLFQQDDGYKKQKCYKVLQGLDVPCEFCTNPLLSRDEFYHWTYYNPLIGQSLILKDRIVDWYGQPARIEFATNVTELDTLRRKAEEQNHLILSSIDYASKIQRNLLPRDQVFKDAFADYSIIWSPRDIVGGDIYWMENYGAGSLLCVCDCTGHGTPGALLTMLVASTLKDIIHEDSCQDTAQVISLMDKRIATVLNVNKAARNRILDFDDGCDMAALFIAKDGRVTISSSNIHVLVCDGEEVRRIKGQKLRIGEGRIRSRDDVNTIVIPAGQNHKFYIASDGLYDQVGGEPACPFGYQAVQDILLEYHHEPQAMILEKIWDAFERHRGSQPRRDDVEIIAFCTDPRKA